MFDEKAESKNLVTLSIKAYFTCLCDKVTNNSGDDNPLIFIEEYGDNHIHYDAVIQCRISITMQGCTACTVTRLPS
jgi:hypothetical protein